MKAIGGRRFYAEAKGDLVVAVEEVERLKRRVVRRSRTGFSFYGDDDETSTS